MTFAAHWALGMGCSGAFARILGLKRWMKNSIAIVGGLLSVSPDAVDWLAATFFGTQRWVIYGIMHHDPPWWLSIWPPYWLCHLAPDKLIHLYSGYNWWPQFWYYEIEMWLIAGVLIYYTWSEAILTAIRLVKSHIFKKGPPDV